jgi:conserved hypothetical protein (putative transposase or invertase)
MSKETIKEVPVIDYNVLKGKPFNRLNDVFAKYLFGNETNKTLTLALINSVFELEGKKEIVDFEFRDRELDPDRGSGKGVLLDVTGKCSDGTIVNVEFQISSMKGMDKRTLYYWSLLYGRRLNSGESYAGLNRTVVIGILAYELFKPQIWSDYHSSFAVLNTKDLGHRLTDDLEIHFVELPKWEKHKSERKTKLERWLTYLSPKTTEEERRKLAMEDKAIRDAMKAEKVFLSNPDYITAYEQHEKYVRDMRAIKEFEKDAGREEGIAIGEARGEKRGLAKAAHALQKKGKPESEIAELLDLDIVKVRELLAITCGN